MKRIPNDAPVEERRESPGIPAGSAHDTRTEQSLGGLRDVTLGGSPGTNASGIGDIRKP